MTYCKVMQVPTSNNIELVTQFWDLSFDFEFDLTFWPALYTLGRREGNLVIYWAHREFATLLHTPCIGAREICALILCTFGRQKMHFVPRASATDSTMPYSSNPQVLKDSYGARWFWFLGLLYNCNLNLKFRPRKILLGSSNRTCCLGLRFWIVTWPEISGNFTWYSVFTTWHSLMINLKIMLEQ